MFFNPAENNILGGSTRLQKIWLVEPDQLHSDLNNSGHKQPIIQHSLSDSTTLYKYKYLRFILYLGKYAINLLSTYT